jgi:hypothetical protein
MGFPAGGTLLYALLVGFVGLAVAEKLEEMRRKKADPKYHMVNDE